MAEHEHEPEQAAEAARPAARGPQAPMSLPSAIGNRAMSRIVQRMEVAEASDALKKATDPGVIGAERQVMSTLSTFQRDVVGFDKLAIDYQKKTEQPLMPKVQALDGPDGATARAQIPPGFFPTISGEKYPEPKK